MEQLFGLVNTLLQDNPETQKRRLGVRTYKVIPFTPSAGVLEWVDGTVPLLEYLLGSTRAGGAHGRYGAGDWTFMACREHMSTETDKRRAYQTVCSNFRCAFSLP
jgi:ataxia telangiectasia mutated family protein